MYKLNILNWKSFAALCVVLQTVGCGSGGGESTAAASSSDTAVVADDTNTTPVASTAAAASSPVSSPATNSAPAPAVATPPPAAVSAPVTTTEKRVSIAKWVACSSALDNSEGVARAFDAAKNQAFTLVVDCPLRIEVGTDIARTIFIDNGTKVDFTSTGKFVIDNTFIPAFVIANSSNIALTNWNVEWDASLPVDPRVNGYKVATQFVASTGQFAPGAAFNDLRLTPWLAANRAIHFDRSEGGVNSMWAGPTNTSAVFFIAGDVAGISIEHMKLYAAANAGGDRFIPMAFSLTRNFKSNQTVSPKTTATAAHVAVPHNLTFTDIDLDGTYMGWQGNLQSAAFTGIRSHRYGDLQDSKGGTVGGVGKWFAPPHLFYLNYLVDGDPALFNKGIQISDVVDDGLRVGVARDKGGQDTVSGYASSLKIGCIGCSVAGYKTSRPDGFLDLLSSGSLHISNVQAVYDSSFINNLFPGMRFPGAPYSNVIFENIEVEDLADSPEQPPIGSSFQTANDKIVMNNVHAVVKRWEGSASLVSTFVGQNIDITLDYRIAMEGIKYLSRQTDKTDLTLKAGQDNIRIGAPYTLSWFSKGSTSCTASGAWAGSLTTNGTKTLTFSSAGDYNLSLSCGTGTGSVATAAQVDVTP
jgi:hypothetical protein